MISNLIKNFNRKEVIEEVNVLALTNELFISKNKTIEYDRTGGNYFYFAYPTVIPMELK